MLNDIYVSFYAELKTRFSSSRIIVENFINPLFILFIFGIAMSNFLDDVTMGERSVPYIVYFISGSINISLITNCSVASTRLFLDKYIGRFDYYIVSPISRASILVGRLLFHILISIIQILLMTLFVKLIYPQYISININYLVFIGITLIGSIGWFCVLFYISFIIESQDGFNVMYYLVMTPVIYLSSIYYPIDKFIFPLRIIGVINPLTWSTDMSRALILNVYDQYFILKCIMIIAFALISYLLVIRKISTWTR